MRHRWSLDLRLEVVQGKLHGNASELRNFRRALQLRPNDPAAAYNLALLSYRGQRYADARALMRVVMQQASPAPEALFLGKCVEQKLGDTQAEQSYALQLRNRYPESAETKAIGLCP